MASLALEGDALSPLLLGDTEEFVHVCGERVRSGQYVRLRLEAVFVSNESDLSH